MKNLIDKYPVMMGIVILFAYLIADITSSLYFIPKMKSVDCDVSRCDWIRDITRDENGHLQIDRLRKFDR